MLRISKQRCFRPRKKESYRAHKFREIMRNSIDDFLQLNNVIY